jgi:hypothetical protein
MLQELKYEPILTFPVEQTRKRLVIFSHLSLMERLCFAFRSAGAEA